MNTLEELVRTEFRLFISNDELFQFALSERCELRAFHTSDSILC